MSTDDDQQLLYLINEESKLLAIMKTKQSQAYALDTLVSELAQKRDKARALLSGLFLNLSSLRDAPIVTIGAFQECAKGIRTYRVALEHFEKELQAEQKRLVTTVEEFEKAKTALNETREKIEEKKETGYGKILQMRRPHKKI